jgi:hypothetical protein
MKKCVRCDQSRSLDEFYSNPRQRDGLHSYCKSCCRDIKQVARDKTRDLVFSAYGGYICVCCGETEPLFLTIDHIHNDGAAHRKSINGGGTRLYDWLRARNYPDGFQVLCLNCNMGKYRNGGTCPHKTSAAICTGS